MARKGTGLMIVWADIPAEMEDDFNAWYNEEHLAELLSVPGILNAARYEATSSGPKHMAVYELESPAVIETDAFRNRPRTEWGKRVSPSVIGTTVINNVYEMIHPSELTDDIANSEHGARPADWPDGRARRERRRMERVVLGRLCSQLREGPRMHSGAPLESREGQPLLRHGLRVRGRERVADGRVAATARNPSRQPADAGYHDPRIRIARHLEEDLSACSQSGVSGS